MTARFQKEIKNLKKELLYLSSIVEENLEKAIESVLNRDADLAEKVKSKDKTVDKLEISLEEECLKILALYQPVARDLRLIIAIIKMNNDLERISDLAKNIAKNSIFLAQYPDVMIPFDFSSMAIHAQKMMRKCLDALMESDSEKALQVCKMDDYLDEINNNMYKLIGDYLKNYPENTNNYIHMASVSRAMERVGDLIVNMAEDIYYQQEGKIIRHQQNLDNL
ncbi:MAG: phosphate signaling complex protein PhoU [Myxococcota bacterium]